MDDALVQDDFIDLIVEELDRCWEVTQHQDNASKIEKAFFETQRDVRMETIFMSYVVRRKLNFQQLESALGTSLPAVIKGHPTLRDAKFAESSYDKVVMWTVGSSDYDDVMRALVRLDRPEMRHGTSELPQRLLFQARPAFQHPGYRVAREDLNVAQMSRGFFGPRRGASGRDQGPRMKRSSIQQLKLRTRCARCRKLGHWARECPEGNRGQRNDERYVRRKLKRVHHCSKAHGTKTFLSRCFPDIRHSRPWESLVGYWCSRGTRRETAT